MAFFYRGTPENRELRRIVPCTLYPFPRVAHTHYARIPPFSELRVKSEEWQTGVINNFRKRGAARTHHR